MVRGSWPSSAFRMLCPSIGSDPDVIWLPVTGWDLECAMSLHTSVPLHALFPLPLAHLIDHS